MHGKQPYILATPGRNHAVLIYFVRHVEYLTGSADKRLTLIMSEKTQKPKQKTKNKNNKQTSKRTLKSIQIQEK